MRHEVKANLAAFERVAEIAREADAPEIAEAVETVEITATKAEEEGPEVDLGAMGEAIEGLTEQLEESNQLAKEKADKEHSAEEAGEESKGNDSFRTTRLARLNDQCSSAPGRTQCEPHDGQDRRR
jgi:hypothetical protein